MSVYIRHLSLQKYLQRRLLIAHSRIGGAIDAINKIVTHDPLISFGVIQTKEAARQNEPPPFSTPPMPMASKKVYADGRAVEVNDVAVPLVINR